MLDTWPCPSDCSNLKSVPALAVPPLLSGCITRDCVPAVGAWLPSFIEPAMDGEVSCVSEDSAVSVDGEFSDACETSVRSGDSRDDDGSAAEPVDCADDADVAVLIGAIEEFESSDFAWDCAWAWTRVCA